MNRLHKTVALELECPTGAAPIPAETPSTWLVVELSTSGTDDTSITQRDRSSALEIEHDTLIEAAEIGIGQQEDCGWRGKCICWTTSVGLVLAGIWKIYTDYFAPTAPEFPIEYQ